MVARQAHNLKVVGSNPAPAILRRFVGDWVSVSLSSFLARRGIDASPDSFQLCAVAGTCFT